MSSFNCKHCHAMCTDTDNGYVTGCEHYPVNPRVVHHYLLKQLCLLDNSLPFLARVASENGHFTAEPLKRWSQDLKTTIGLMLGGKPISADSLPARDRAPSPELSTPPACGRSETCSRCETGCRE
jgi:hypothetical protein